MFLTVCFERATIWEGKLNVYSLHACVHSNLYNSKLDCHLRGLEIGATMPTIRVISQFSFGIISNYFKWQQSDSYNMLR